MAIRNPHPIPLNPALAQQVAELNADEREFFEERAAIREFEGGLSRAEAEILAWQDLCRRRLAPPMLDSPLPKDQT